MDDLSRPVATSDDTDFSVTIDEALQRYTRAGLPRTSRSIQRYCANGHLDARKIETPYGEKFLITPASIDKHIAYIQEVMDATSRDVSRHVGAPVMAETASPVEATLIPPHVATSPDTSRHVATVDGESRYVTRLESEVDFLRGQVATKDAQIKELTERSRETNVLIGGLQRMLSPLLGAPDPMRRDDARPIQ